MKPRRTIRKVADIQPGRLWYLSQPTLHDEMSAMIARQLELIDELADTPTLSAYLSTDHVRLHGGTHAAWRVEVAGFVSELRDHYAHAVARPDRDLLERNLRRLELRLRGLPHAVRASGWLVIVARGDIHYCEPLSTRGRSEGRWQHGPWFATAPEVQSAAM